MVARHSATRNHGVGEVDRFGGHGQMREEPISLRNEGRGAAVRAVGEASKEDWRGEERLRSQEYKKRTSTDVGVGGLYMHGRDRVGNVRPIRTAQWDKME